MTTSITGSDSQTGTTASTLVSASLSWNNGDVVIVMSNGRDTTGDISTITTTGTGLSFTQQQALAQNRTRLELHTAVATATSSGTITITYTDAMDSCQGHFAVTDATAVEATGGAVGFSQTPSTTVTPTSTDTLIIGIAGSSQTGNAISIGSGYTELFNVNSGTGGDQSRSMSEHKNETSTSAVTFDAAVATSSVNWCIACVAITSPGAGGGRIMSSLAAAGGLAHLGGIAGRGGGLAG